MKSLLLCLACLTLASCKCPPSSRRPSPTAPDISIVHLQGKVTQMPARSRWPDSIKVGTPFDYWAVINNRVSDSESSPSQGSYFQKGWPSRYDLTIGDLRFSSDSLPRPDFWVTIYDEKLANLDGYMISSGYGATLAAAPELDGVAFNVSLRWVRKDLITSDKLPIHAISINSAPRDCAPVIIGQAHLKSDHTDQSFSVQADRFEVFQASAETPLKLPSELKVPREVRSKPVRLR